MATNKKNSKTVKEKQNIAMFYEIAMPEPANHLFEITLLINLDQIDKKLLSDHQLTLKMPVWTPGSYLVREYSRHVQDFSASTQDHKILNWQKTSKNCWQIALPTSKKGQEIIVKYRVYANELTVRTNHLDATHGYFNSAALLFYIAGIEKQPIQIQIITPPHFTCWQVTTPLPRIAEQPPTFLAPDFDTLVDSPFEIGEQQIFDFSVQGKKHQLVIYGAGNIVPNKIIPSIEKIIEEEAKIFGGLPYDHYIFLLHLSGDSYGGLEHKDCCSLIYPRLGFHQTEKKERFLQLVAHEFFHLWNIKRIRPKELETFDYDQENYTPALWFSEGATSYYDLLIPQRAGIYNAKVFCKNISQEITQLQTIPGRKIQTVSESSWDAWIKLYRRDAYSNNNQISYYLKGELVTFLLDLKIRAEHNNTRSFDDVMRQLWQDFGKDEIGFTAVQLQAVIENIADADLHDFFDKYVHGTEELPFEEYLEPFGLQLKIDFADIPFVGWQVATENGKEIVKFVESNSPAQLAGIDAGDQLLAINGWKVTADKLGDRLREYICHDVIHVSFFHQDQLQTKEIILGDYRPQNYHIIPVKRPSASQSKNFQDWFGESLSILSTK